MTHEEAINAVAALPMSVRMSSNGVGFSVVEDEDGFEVSVSSYLTNKKRTLRYDAVKGIPGQYVRYDVDKKPTTRTHEVVFVGNDPMSWAYDNLDYYINLVNKR